MKRVNAVFPLILCLLASFLLLVSSCDKMNDIQEKFASREETVYLGKVDSIQTFPGFGRAKLTWYLSADPKIQRTIIYWNLRQDSIVKEFDRHAAGIVKDSVIIEDLPEGAVRFEFRNENDQGETSLYTSALVTVWGPEFADNLFARKLTGFDYNYAESTYTLNLSPTHEGDGVVYSEMNYKDINGVEQTVKIDRDSTNIELDGFPDGGELMFRTVFSLTQGIDTVYNDYEVFKAPTAIVEAGKKMSMTGNMTSKYFGREDSLYEWNANGDLIVYATDPEGVVTQGSQFLSILPRTNYKDFFFYDADKFIAISNDDGVYMYQFEAGQLQGIGGKFGSGFNFQAFIPSRGFFFTVTAGTGDLRAWFARGDATWGTPNGTTSGMGFAEYQQLTMFNGQTLLAIDADGYLWSYPVLVNGNLGPMRRIGSGWNRFKKIVSVGTKLICMEENGDFYLFNDFNATDNFWVVN